MTRVPLGTEGRYWQVAIEILSAHPQITGMRAPTIYCDPGDARCRMKGHVTWQMSQGITHLAGICK